METQVTINGKDLKVKYGLKTLFKFEELEGHPFEFKKMEDSYKLLYASLIAHNPEYSQGYDEFLDACDEDPSIFEKFVKLTEDAAKRSVKKKNPANQ